MRLFLMLALVVVASLRIAMLPVRLLNKGLMMTAQWLIRNL